MASVHPILADVSAGISELKKNPMAVLKEANGETVAILNRNQPVFYAVPAHVYEAMLDALDDLELAAIVEERKNDERIRVNIDDL
ncbi:MULTISPECIES: type II toxin-antitoxin system Phd/YefM family antitoxin [Gammaproteobacteria]|uniref:type II toxin-antitoxin system Phd/YefM family antitoxin n=1 Tax=Gammaproteobacteria TaxID=1236 RepID=UPI0013D25699|nr:MULTISPECIES: type II toxin-antitoxin system Phd/YefM family antitoxin [Gammaproteobacteria]MBO9484456.1 type II toxin-antitoxin system Phd/YefM family antitoxin [Salinisphaera sp. G21_0]MBO9496985.1 type II toxin-antitoxin system Phd/YefM family antitoxin [Thalassotalea sp. G20_0]WBA83726.1 type II toxin-antitoxin system Phd/YefM family antitoxin [Endozoicomonas sp. GU-1]WBA86708.1 type II toxin-antitoxin system Phd/YefM family antitoxin [Endozoicomonas sp. GU-1]